MDLELDKRDLGREGVLKTSVLGGKVFTELSDLRILYIHIIGAPLKGTCSTLMGTGNGTTYCDKS